MSVRLQGLQGVAGLEALQGLHGSLNMLGMKQRANGHPLQICSFHTRINSVL